MEFQQNTPLNSDNPQVAEPQQPINPKRSIWKIIGIIVGLFAVLLIAYSVYIVNQVSPSNLAKDPRVISEFEKISLAQRDAVRLSDIRQFKVKLDLYYQDQKRYPESLNQLVPNYAVKEVYAPVPADSPCTEQTNTYSYISTGNSYTLTFCIGTSGEEGFAPGMHTLDPSGTK